MAKNIRRMFAMVLVMCMILSALPMQALAAEGDGVITETVDGVEITTTTTTTTSGGDGTPTVTIEIKEAVSSGTNSEGTQVSGMSTDTTTTVTDTEGTVTGISTSHESTITTSTTSTNAETGTTTQVETEETKKSSTDANGDHYSYENTDTFTAVTDANGNAISEKWTEDGSEQEVTHKAPNVTVDVPTEEGITNIEETPTLEPVVSGDIQQGEDDTDYNQTTTTVQGGSVTVKTDEVNISSTVGDSELEHVSSDVTPDDDNDLLRDKTSNTGVVLPVDPETAPASKEGYEYVFIGSGNSSQFWVAYLKTTPSKEGEEPVYSYVDEDGQTVNLYAGPKGQTVDELYIEGEKVELDESVKIGRSGTFQFVMYNPETKKVSTTYCADLMTGAEKGYYYNIENLEDADYYSDEEAAMIRTIASNGYWGTVDDPETEEIEHGSLDAVKEMMRNAKKDGKAVFTEEEIASLTDGMALSATQYAIWTFSNKMNNVQIINSMYSTANSEFILNGYWKDVPADEAGKLDVMFKLYNHLINMDPTAVEKPTTEDTIINADNFLKDMSVTVVQKAENHDNNQDADDSNDAYVTNLTFALVVQPSTDNGDDLVVTVVDANGNEIAKGRIAGQAADGETVLTPDDNGNYCFEGITMIEGDQNFKLNLSGIQNLKEGVYLYSSEVKNGSTSQTMVGMAGGKQNVNVTMDLKFNVTVEDEVIVTERVWHSEGDPGSGVPGDGEPTPVNDEGEPVAPQVFRLNNQDNLEEIPEEPVPLAAPAITGDNSGLWVAVILLSLFCMVAVNVFDKKRQHEAF